MTQWHYVAFWVGLFVWLTVDTLVKHGAFK